MYLVGFITKKFVTMHSHMNVKKNYADILIVLQVLIFGESIVRWMVVMLWDQCTCEAAVPADSDLELKANLSVWGVEASSGEEPQQGRI